ncbi:MAG: type II toxin-antitoxin system antitoxin SocA domain-containing protein [Acidobacteriota bacterium]
MPIPNSRHKLKQLILYVAAKMKDADSFGETKLNKVLFRADMACYRDLGESLTDFKFQKNHQGPTLRAFLPITREMTAQGVLAWNSRFVGSVNENRPIALAEPDLEAISPQERALIDEEIARAWMLTGGQMSDEEHVTAAWFALRQGETISPELCFVENPLNIIPLSEKEESRAKEAIDRYRARTAVSPDLSA